MKAFVETITITGYISDDGEEIKYTEKEPKITKKVEERHFDAEGFDQLGYNKEYFDRNGYDIDGWDKDGYNVSGYNERGYDRNGYNRYGYDADGYNKDGYDEYGDKRPNCEDCINIKEEKIMNTLDRQINYTAKKVIQKTGYFNINEESFDYFKYETTSVFREAYGFDADGFEAIVRDWFEDNRHFDNFVKHYESKGFKNVLEDEEFLISAENLCSRLSDCYGDEEFDDWFVEDEDNRIITFNLVDGN